MKKQKDASTMSVSEMRCLLGIKKTESYWLVKKRMFDTLQFKGELRIVKSSFEKWYANQDHYHKVSGEEPGKALHKTAYTVQNIADLLGISCDTALLLIRKNNIPYTLDQLNHHTLRVGKQHFDEWLEQQTRYRTAEQREHDKQLVEASYSIPEMGRKIGLDRRVAYKLAYRFRDDFETVAIGGRKRITIDSFEQWYLSQTEYTKIDESSLARQGQAKAPEKVFTPKASYTIREAADYLHLDEQQVYSMITDGSLHGRKVGKSWRISCESLFEQERRNENGIDY